ncbi:hypothetical protein CHUAL_005350 [Chamberlinius hualienensis]
MALSRLSRLNSYFRLYQRTQLFKDAAALQVIQFKVRENGAKESHHWSSDYKQSHQRYYKYIGGALLLLSGGALLNFPVAYAKESKDETSASVRFPNLPTYTANDVAKHDTKEKGIWVSFRSGVYDLTEFVDQHPGGDKILMGAGGALEPFWLLYAFHDSPQIYRMLENYRIGNLAEDDIGEATQNMSDPYSGDPKRHAALKPSSVKPFNAEPPLQILVESHHTPNDLFFVRHHLPVPNIDEANFELEIEGDKRKTSNFKLQDLKVKFPQYTVDATLQCAGNRRSEMTKLKPVKGLNWGSAAISNAKWTGVKLRDVLLSLGYRDDDPKLKHVQFEGLDTDVTGTSYGASISYEKAMDPKGDVLLAFEMNGEPLPRDHGYPLRVIVPGIVGARNVKWVTRIILSEEESNSHWQQNDYKGFSPDVDWDTVDFKSAPAIQELPVQSAICDPVEGSKVSVVNGKVKVSGYSWSGGGRQVVRVDVSADGGKSWHTAQLHPCDSPLNHSWAWRLWQVEIPVSADTKSNSKLELICKAVDSSYNVQPDTVAPVWNLRGVLNNAWHRVNVTVK